MVRWKQRLKIKQLQLHCRMHRTPAYLTAQTTAFSPYLLKEGLLKIQLLSKTELQIQRCTLHLCTISQPGWRNSKGSFVAVLQNSSPRVCSLCTALCGVMTCSSQWRWDADRGRWEELGCLVWMFSAGMRREKCFPNWVIVVVGTFITFVIVDWYLIELESVLHSSSEHCSKYQRLSNKTNYW